MLQLGIAILHLRPYLPNSPQTFAQGSGWPILTSKLTNKLGLILLFGQKNFLNVAHPNSGHYHPSIPINFQVGFRLASHCN